MTDHVDETIRHWRNTTFEWGVADCMLSAADYVQRVQGRDPTPEFRGTYSTAEGADKAQRDGGGIVALLDSREGLERSDKPVRGDLAVVWTGEEYVVGLCTGPGLAMRLLRGVTEIDMRFLTVIACWKV